jgi:hypothetical protein
MDLPEAIEFCLKMKGAEETSPFGPDVLVYKVAGKMSAQAPPPLCYPLNGAPKRPTPKAIS